MRPPDKSKGLLQDVMGTEHQGIERLVSSASRHLPLHREIFNIFLHCCHIINAFRIDVAEKGDNVSFYMSCLSRIWLCALTTLYS